MHMVTRKRLASLLLAKTDFISKKWDQYIKPSIFSVSCWVCLFLCCGGLMRSCVSAQGEWRNLTPRICRLTHRICHLTHRICHLTHRICVTSHTGSVWPHTQDLCHSTHRICATSHARFTSPHTQDLRHVTHRMCVTSQAGFASPHTQDGNKLRPSLLPPKRVVGKCQRLSWLNVALRPQKP